MEIKKKIIPFIFGLSMLAALPLAAHADPTPVDGDEQDSGNVTYSGGFVDVGGGVQAPSTDVVTAIPECTLTIPKDTVIKRGARKADIGNITVDGKYFVKPYYIQVYATKQDFTNVNNNTQKIIFNVDSEENGDGTKAFITTDDSTTPYTTTYKCRNFWKDETLTENQDTDYLDGEVTNIAGREHIWIKTINDGQWEHAQGGRYKGRVTFNVEFMDDFTSTGQSATAEWASKTI